MRRVDAGVTGIRDGLAAPSTGQLAVHLRARFVLQPVRFTVDARAHVVARIEEQFACSGH
jgi:hypothetical protein